MSPALDVWCFGERAGELRARRGGAMAFAYDTVWVANGRPPLSQSLPLSGDFTARAAHAFFGGLLPEGTPREVLARRLGLSPGNEFALLEQVGEDCAGAVSLLPAGATPADRPGFVAWLDDDAVATLVRELPQRPMHADEGGEHRLSLAGAQDKVPVVVGDDGRIGLPSGSQPSTHILKAPIVRLPATVANEAFCLALGRELGVQTANAEPRVAGGEQFLLVERYDRAWDDGVTIRLHQEDFCQALGVPSERKYQREGGPGLRDCFALVRAATAVPAAGLGHLLDGWALSFLVGNHDAHAKNYSLLRAPAETAVAPAYDVLSTVVYWKVDELDRKMAMHVGGEYRPAYVRPRHLARMVEEAGMSVRFARRRLAALAGQAPAAAARVRDRFHEDDWWHPLLDAVVETIAQRAAWMTELTAAG